MVWKSPLRQHSRGGTNEASSSSSQPLLSSPAEIQVREIASKIGLFEDSEILANVCHKMRKEYVVEEWQLPVLDSRQWEKMHAPIGLAVAVQHISAHRLREKQMQSPFEERQVHNNTQTYNEKGRKERVLFSEEKKQAVEENEEDPLVPLSFHKDMARSNASSAGLSNQEKEKEDNEIVANITMAASSADHSMVEIEARTAYIEASTITADEKVKDEPSKTENVVTMNANEQCDERNNPPLASDNFEKIDEFSEDCADWSKLAMIATEKDEQESLEREEEYNHGTEVKIALPEIDNNGDEDFHEEIDDSTMSPASSSSVKIAEIAQVNMESVNGIEQNIPRSVENKKEATQVETEPVDSSVWEKSTALEFVKKKQEEAQVGIESIDRIEREIPTIGEKNLEAAQVKTESLDGIEQKFSTAPAKGSREQKTSQVKFKSIESTRSDCATRRNHAEKKETKLVENVAVDGIDTVTTTLQDEKKLEKDFKLTQREETPEISSSDSEPDDSTTIFSGLGNSVSFSEDEDDHRLPDKKSSQLDRLLDPLESREDATISSRNDLENYLLLFPDYDPDDVTVVVSNVSPECKKSVSKIKMKHKYRHEYDRGTSSFEIETVALQQILVKLPDDDHRAILSQLMIMTNARDKVSRTNLAFQVQDSLVALIEKNELDVMPAKAVQLIFHLSRLKKSYRMIFAKSLFKAMSKLYKRTEKLKKKNSPKKKDEKSINADLKNLIQVQQATQQRNYRI